MKNEVEERRKKKGRRGPWTDEIATKRNYTVGCERGVRMLWFLSSEKYGGSVY